MTKTINLFTVSVLLLGSLFFATTAYASHYTMDGYYEPVDNECEDGDIEISKSGNLGVVEHCLEEEVADEADEAAEDRTLLIPSGSSVMTVFGFMDTCPVWYPMDCVIDPSLIR